MILSDALRIKYFHETIPDRYNSPLFTPTLPNKLKNLFLKIKNLKFKILINIKIVDSPRIELETQQCECCGIPLTYEPFVNIQCKPLRSPKSVYTESRIAGREVDRRRFELPTPSMPWRYATVAPPAQLYW